MISHAVWVNKHLSNYKQFSKTTNCTCPMARYIIQFCCVCSIHEKIKSNQYLIKITLQKDINTHWYPTNLSVGNSQLFTAFSWWREKCIIFTWTLLLSQGWLSSNFSLEYYLQITHRGHENKGTDHQLKKLLIVKHVLLSTPQEIYGNFIPAGVVFSSSPHPHLPNFSSIAPF